MTTTHPTQHPTAPESGPLIDEVITALTPEVYDNVADLVTLEELYLPDLAGRLDVHGRDGAADHLHPGGRP